MIKIKREVIEDKVKYEVECELIKFKGSLSHQIKVGISILIAGLGAGAAVLALGLAFGLQGYSRIVAIAFLVIGLMVALARCFKPVITRVKMTPELDELLKQAQQSANPEGVEIIPSWDDKLVEDTLRNAPSHSTVRILQTWFPDNEKFCEKLGKFLKDNQRFHLRILLMNCGKTATEGKLIEDLPYARVRLRKECRKKGHLERRKYARRHIIETIENLREMKKDVDKEWAKMQLGVELDLQIRWYKFMPFGPIYQIVGSGEDPFYRLFVGFYHNSKSSACAPMLFVRDRESDVWKEFEEHFTAGWNDSEEVPEKIEG